MEYEVQRRLGRGGMGVVDLAVDRHGTVVACKRLLLHGSADEMHRARQRIRREADALAQLRHPNIVPLLDVVDDGDDVVLVLPYLPGGTLSEQVAHHGPLTPGQVHVLADALFAALAEAHRQGVVHRDIKPANVLFDADGRPFLTDFGVATLRDATGGLTVTGAVIGTPEFMAPEQARGEIAGPEADVFSLGATLLFGATGHPPYGKAEPPVVLSRAARGRLSPLPADLDRPLRRRLSPTLARSPQRRPAAATVATSGPRGPGALPVAGPGGTTIAPPPRRRLLRRGALGLTFGLVAALAVVLTAVALANRDSEVAAGPTTTTAPPCTDLPYQPCGAPPAPNTDGRACLVGWFDVDGDPTTGCEVRSDDLNGTVLEDALTANLVPADAVDRYPFRVEHEDNRLLSLIDNTFCDNVLRVTLVGPPDVSMRLEVLAAVDSTVLGTAISADAMEATVRLTQPGCTIDASDLDLVAQVSWFGEGRSGGEYSLSRRGSW